MTKTILIVDDDMQIRNALRKVLAMEGYQIVLAANGQEGVEQFHRHPIDLLLLDLNMPVKNGWDTFERLTDINPLIPVVIITGRRQQFDLAAAAGVGAVIEKPLDVPSLLQTVRELLAEPPETSLQRLAGQHAHARHVPPRSDGGELPLT